MTPKEALRILGQMTTKRNLQDFPIGNQPKQFVKMKIKEMPEFENIENALNELEALKKPPAVDEVIEALSTQLKSTIVLRKNKHGFTFNYAGTGKTIISLNYNLLNIKAQLPPHLITLIGRFYEGLEVEE